MIDKLKKKIFLLITISLSVVVLVTIILFSTLNYTNTINTAVSLIDKVSEGNSRKELLTDKANPNKLINSPMQNIDGIYFITVEDSKVVKSSINMDKQSEEIEKIAIEISNKNSEKGIYGKYVFKIKNINPRTKVISIIENEKVNLQVRNIILVSIAIGVIALLVTFIIAKKISVIIVKPVEDSFEKQKQFISDASHELKTPLAVIRANTDVLENELGKNKWLNYIQNEIESMNKLVNELLLLTKIENTENLKEYKQFDLTTEIELILSMFESMAYENNIKIEGKIQENVTFNGCKDDIEHILTILVDNAIKHSEEGNSVIVELVKEKGEIIIQVKNMGKPIPEEERDKIFERFYRIDKSRNRNEKRYGLGLAIAKSIIQKYNGKIEIICENGITNFKVIMPT